MFTFLKITWVMIALLTLGSTLSGWGPKQSERPPQPFFQDFFSGSVLVEGAPPPEGTLLIACIDSCEEVFESAPHKVNTDGSFDQLEVNPVDEGLVGHVILFYLANEYGRIKAVETRPYIGVFDFYKQDLTFVDAMPVFVPASITQPTEHEPQPTPVAALPVAGDPLFARMLKWAVIIGVLVSLAGGSLLIFAKRNADGMVVDTNGK